MTATATTVLIGLIPVSLDLGHTRILPLTWDA
jgi:hypothetical protein